MIGNYRKLELVCSEIERASAAVCAERRWRDDDKGGDGGGKSEREAVAARVLRLIELEN